jgi:hypothetical protein
VGFFDRICKVLTIDAKEETKINKCLRYIDMERSTDSITQGKVKRNPNNPKIVLNC